MVKEAAVWLVFAQTQRVNIPGFWGRARFLFASVGARMHGIACTPLHVEYTRTRTVPCMRATLEPPRLGLCFVPTTIRFNILRILVPKKPIGPDRKESIGQLLLL